MRNLDEIRKDINRIDAELLNLFKERMDCAKEVGEYKKANGIPVLNADREREILDKVELDGGEYGGYARELFEKLMELSRELQHSIIEN